MFSFLYFLLLFFLLFGVLGVSPNEAICKIVYLARQIRSSLYRRNQPLYPYIKLYFGRRKSPTVYHCRALISTLWENGFYYADYSFYIFGKPFPFIERENPNLKVVFYKQTLSLFTIFLRIACHKR